MHRIRIRNGVLLLLALFFLLRAFFVDLVPSGDQTAVFVAAEANRFLSQGEGMTLTAADAEKSYLKWAEFRPTAQALKDALAIDIATHTEEHPVSWIPLLACYAAKHGGSFSAYRTADLKELATKLSQGADPLALAGSEKSYAYHLEAYTAVLGGMVGEYRQNGQIHYGLTAVSPIAKGFSYSHYDDFGAKRSYGYSRPHLGHDLMGSIGTPIVAIESGYVEALGWNQYGGWRIGIRSFDGKRYYYYAHLRRDHPYRDLYEGKIVNAGEVIGYLGMTGYSAKENVNNIDTPHLHYGLQLIFDPSQKDGWNQIWVDLYALTDFLASHRSQVVYDPTTKEYNAVSPIERTDVPD